MTKTQEHPPASHDYLITLDWIDRADNLCLVGPAGTGKTHYLIALGRAAIEAGHRVRYYTAAELVEHLWRATADNTVGRTIEQLYRNQLRVIDEIGFAPLDHTGCQLLFHLVAAAYEKSLPRYRLAHTHHSRTGDGSSPTNPPPSPSSTGSATTPTSSSSPPPATATDSPTASPKPP